MSQFIEPYFNKERIILEDKEYFLLKDILSKPSKPIKPIKPVSNIQKDELLKLQQRVFDCHDLFGYDRHISWILGTSKAPSMF